MANVLSLDLRGKGACKSSHGSGGMIQLRAA